MRPSGIDTTAHPEIRDWIPKRKGLKKLVQDVVFPVLRYMSGGMASPSKDLARVLTELASSDGAALEGKAIEGEGRTVNEGTCSDIGTAIYIIWRHIMALAKSNNSISDIGSCDITRQGVVAVVNSRT